MKVTIQELLSQVLLIFKGVGRIHSGGTISMDGGDGDGDKNSDQGRYHKEVPLHINVSAEVIKPLSDHHIGQGPADQIGN